MIGAVLAEIWIEALRQARTNKHAAAVAAAAITLVSVLTAIYALPRIFGHRTSMCAVAGKVKLAGEPIEFGEIAFTPEATSSGQRRSAIICDGAFSLPISGGLFQDQQYVVEIRGMRPTGRQYLSQGRSVDKLEQFVPDRFNSLSELQFCPTSNPCSINYDLKP